MALTITSELLDQAAARLDLGNVASSYPLTAPRHKTGTRMLVLASGERWAIKFDDDPMGDGQGWRRELVGWQRARRAGIPCAEEIRALAPEEPWKCGLVAVKQLPGVSGDTILNAHPQVLKVSLSDAAHALAAWHRTPVVAAERRFPLYDDHLASRSRFAESLSRRISQVAQAGLIPEPLRGRLIYFLDQNLPRFEENAAIPIHYDANVANMLFDRTTGHLTGILDFETLTLGPAKYDLAPMYAAMSCDYYTKDTFADDPAWYAFWKAYTGRTSFTREDRLEVTLYALDALFHAHFVPDYWYSVFATIVLDGARTGEQGH